MTIIVIMGESNPSLEVSMTITVCILTAGSGTRMGVYSSYINKALLPIGKKAVISHIISHFPTDSEFVIALGVMADQVRNYLTIAHPDTTFHFISVDNYDGQGSGPGYSLLCCRQKLERPFFFVSCDTLWRGDVLDTSTNWLGVAKVEDKESDRFCNVEVDIENHQIISFHDKVLVCGERFRAFTGLAFIKDYKIFWEGLETREMISGEHQISIGLKCLTKTRALKAFEVQWNDVGTLDNYRGVMSKYEAYDFSKTNEFLYILNGQVIKFFANETVSHERVQKTRLNPQVFPFIKRYVPQFYAYEFCPGKTLYEDNNTYIFQKLLKWLDDNLWMEKNCNEEEMFAICQSFYRDKTITRLGLFEKKYPDSNRNSKINGRPVPSIGAMMEKIPWELLYDGIPYFIHGDLQFDNILYDRITAKFLLLDWRQDFAGRLDFGDVYYDYAKLNGGLLLNYDYVKSNLFQYEEDGDEIFFDFAQRQSATLYENILHDFIKSKGHNTNKVELLVPIIYLNMSPLHHYPFDKMLYALGRQMLFRILQKLDAT